MEMSFLEDLLKRDVDQNQVNALVGSLENQLSNTPTSNLTSNLTSSSKTTVDIKPNITAPQQVPVPPPRTTTANSNTSSVRFLKFFFASVFSMLGACFWK